MNNIELRTKIRENRLYQYEIAKRIGITEYTFCKWMREELSEERKELVLRAISDIVKGDTL